jgi:sterol 3beta-glucosyltransferase
LVHHGGFGTTATGFQAGVPMLVIPHIIDQFIWGQRVFELGVGPKPISRSKLNVEAMAEALRKVIQEKDMRTNAQALGEKIRQEQGLSLAVRLIGENV